VQEGKNAHLAWFFGTAAVSTFVGVEDTGTKGAASAFKPWFAFLCTSFSVAGIRFNLLPCGATAVSSFVPKETAELN
jgi:hypothetical protein